MDKKKGKGDAFGYIMLAIFFTSYFIGKEMTGSIWIGGIISVVVTFLALFIGTEISYHTDPEVKRLKAYFKQSAQEEQERLRKREEKAKKMEEPFNWNNFYDVDKPVDEEKKDNIGDMNLF